MANELKMPQLGLTMEEGTVTQWLKREGDSIRASEAILEITTDKLTNEVLSDWDGVLLQQRAAEGDTLPVGAVLAVIGTAGESAPSPAAAIPTETAPAAASAAPTAEKTPSVGRVRISPLAKKTAAQLGVDYSELTGTGPSGRIVQKDILAAAKAPAATSAPAPTAVKTPTPMDGSTERKLSGMRKVVAERMLKSHTEIPNVTQTVKVDVTELMQLRKRLAEDYDAKLSVNDFVLLATAKALRANPHLLVSYEEGKVIQHSHVHLGMAVALDDGLIVPVIRDADQLRPLELAAAARELAKKARENKLTREEYHGSTFSVTNLGMFGVESFTPIINQPNAAILGVCAIEDTLALNAQQQLCTRKVMRLCLTYDHRLLDGAVAAKFECAIKELLEAPVRVLL